MNQRTSILTLGTLALLLGAAGIYYTRANKTSAGNASNPGTRSTPGASADHASAAGTALFPDAAPRMGDAAHLTIRKNAESVDIARSDDGTHWVVASSGGYPALDDNVRALVRSVIDAKVVEPKTAEPSLFAKVGVEDPAAEGATSSLVTISDAKGAALATLIIGKRHEAANWDQSKAGTFVRPAGQNQSYLVSSTYTLATKPVDWMQRTVLAMDAGRFRECVVTPATIDDAHPVLTIARASRSDNTPTLTPMPAGRELAAATGPQHSLQSLGDISLNDVARAQGFAFTAQSTSTFTTFDGVQVTARIMLKDGQHWCMLSVAHDASKAMPPAEGQAAPDSALLDKEAAELHAKVSPWVFVIDEAKAKQLAPTLDQLLKPLATPGDAQQPAPGAPPSRPGSMLMPGVK